MYPWLFFSCQNQGGRLGNLTEFAWGRLNVFTKKVLYCMGEMSAVTNEWHRWTRLVESFQSVQRSSKMVSCIKTYEHFMIYALSEWLLRTIENPGRTSSGILMIIKKKQSMKTVNMFFFVRTREVWDDRSMELFFLMIIRIPEDFSSLDFQSSSATIQKKHIS